MQHLIISAHPSPESFSNLLTESLAHYSRQKGWKVVVRDLYKIGFEPILSSSDLAAIKAGDTPADIHAEQQHLATSDLISLVYPLWWGSFPAVLKGYFDRVLTNGFAFSITSEGPRGLLTGKKAILHTSMGNSVEEYEHKGMLKAFREIHGVEVFGFCGIEVAGHNFYPQIPASAAKVKNQYIKQALNVYETVFQEEAVISQQ